MKALILLRGLPGSGKTTLANLLSEKGKYPVFSIDAYFTNPESGEYKFEFSKNYLAYKKCEENAESALRNGIEKVFIDNTFTLEWELEIYFKLALKYHYQLHVITVENYHNSKNIHHVSDEQISKMAAKFKIKLF